MNKALRQEVKKLKYKKRLLKIGAWNNDTMKSPIGERYNYTGYINHSSPCSCFMCSHSKYDRAKEKVDMKKYLNDTDLG